MRRKRVVFSRRYQAALRQHLIQRSQLSMKAAQALGRQATALGMETLDMARIHEQALGAVMARDPSKESLRRAATFFAEALTPIEMTHRTAREAKAHLDRLNTSLRQCALELTASKRKLKLEVLQRTVAEDALKESERHYGTLLQQSGQMQEQLRRLSHQLLSAQEEERKTISRELHDEIAQTLSGINLQLMALKTAAKPGAKSLQTRITHTQRLVEKSVQTVHRFARELRPSVLDDLGLVPALHSFLKTFAKRTQLQVRLTVLADVEQLDSGKRTVLYRVAQESLTNVARHAHATQVEMSIESVSEAVYMQIKDNGKSFPVQPILHGRKNNRLGLLGMRERVEMVGGRFNIESAPTRGTTVEVLIPFRNWSRKVVDPLRTS